MKDVTTTTGFKIEVDEDNFDNMEFVELLAQAEDETKELMIAPKAIEMTLGKEGKKALYNHVRDEKGRPRASKAIEEFREIISLVGDGGKNS